MTSSDEEPSESLSPEERTELIEDFLANGFATFRLGIDIAEFDALTDYIRHNQIATYTDIDRAGGTVTLTRRPFGSMEFGMG